MTEPLLKVRDLGVDFPVRRRLFSREPRTATAVNSVSFDIAPGETLALVGESGSGKSTIGNAILGLVKVSSGSIVFKGSDLTHLTRNLRRRVASRVQVVFQNPYGSLNPSMAIGDTLSEPLTAMGLRSRAEARARITSLLETVGMPADAAERFPSAFSGGQRQRIAIARALAVEPELIVCDEPTSALDVSTQRVVLDLLTRLQQDTGVAYLFITHDLAVVREFADRVAVLNRGSIVEEGASVRVCDAPEDPYTRRLVAAAPVPDPRMQAERRERRRAGLAPV